MTTLSSVKWCEDDALRPLSRCTLSCLCTCIVLLTATSRDASCGRHARSTALVSARESERARERESERARERESERARERESERAREREREKERARARASARTEEHG